MFHILDYWTYIVLTGGIVLIALFVVWSARNFPTIAAPMPPLPPPLPEYEPTVHELEQQWVTYVNDCIHEVNSSMVHLPRGYHLWLDYTNRPATVELCRWETNRRIIIKTGAEL